MNDGRKPGGRPRKNYTGDGIVFRTQSEAARAAGLSKRQKDTALCVARVPKELFEKLVESDHPPSISELARLGRLRRPTPLIAKMPLPPRSVLRVIEELWLFAQSKESSVIARGLPADITGKLADIVSWSADVTGSAPAVAANCPAKPAEGRSR